MARRQGEVHFIEDSQNGTTIQFEDKSGRGYRTHAAIDAAMANRDYRIPRGVVLSRSNVEQDGDVTYLPLYASWCLAELYGLSSTNDDLVSKADRFIISTIAV